MKIRGLKNDKGIMAGSSRGDGRSAQRADPAHHGSACRRLRALPLRLCVSVAVLVGVSALAQYAIDWHTIDGGGGTSTNGQYSLSGTIGQPDAGGAMTNGQHSVTGGFWALPQAMQTEGAPMLMIAPAGAAQAQISWTPDTGTNWVLQENLNLATTNWINSTSGTNNPVIVPATVPAKFYRLFKP